MISWFFVTHIVYEYYDCDDRNCHAQIQPKSPYCIFLRIRQSAAANDREIMPIIKELIRRTVVPPVTHLCNVHVCCSATARDWWICLWSSNSSVTACRFRPPWDTDPSVGPRLVGQTGWPTRRWPRNRCRCPSSPPSCCYCSGWSPCYFCCTKTRTILARRILIRRVTAERS